MLSSRKELDYKITDNIGVTGKQGKGKVILCRMQKQRTTTPPSSKPPCAHSFSLRFCLAPSYDVTTQSHSDFTIMCVPVCAHVCTKILAIQGPGAVA